MDLRLSEDQQLIREAAREFLQGECPPEFVRRMETDQRGYDPARWRDMTGLGWLGAPFAEDYGGAELGFVELCLILEEQGRCRVIDPLASTVAMAGMTIDRFGSDAQRRRWLPAISAGDAVIAAAVDSGTVAWTRDGDGYRLEGRAQFVPFAHCADALLIAAMGEHGAALFLLDSPERLSVTPLETVGSDQCAHLDLNGVRLEADQRLGSIETNEAAAARLSEFGVAASCAEMLGIADKVLELTIAYACEREQFGKAIGSFQAVQHHCANMAVELLAARWTVYEAIWHLQEKHDAAESVAMAKVVASDACERICTLGHQVHGAVGFTREHNLQLYSRRARALVAMCGDSFHHLEQLAGGLFSA